MYWCVPIYGYHITSKSKEAQSKWKFIGSEMLVDIIQTWSITSRTRNVTRLSICCIYRDTNTRQIWRILFKHVTIYLSIYRELALPSKNLSNICIFLSIHLSSLLFVLLKIIELNECKNHVSWRKVNLLCKLILKVCIKYC